MGQNPTMSLQESIHESLHCKEMSTSHIVAKDNVNGYSNFLPLIFFKSSF